MSSNHIICINGQYSHEVPNHCPCFLQWYQQATEYLPLTLQVMNYIAEAINHDLLKNWKHIVVLLDGHPMRLKLQHLRRHRIGRDRTRMRRRRIASSSFWWGGVWRLSGGPAAEAGFFAPFLDAAMSLESDDLVGGDVRGSHGADVHSHERRKGSAMEGRERPAAADRNTAALFFFFF